MSVSNINNTGQPVNLPQAALEMKADLQEKLYTELLSDEPNVQRRIEVGAGTYLRKKLVFARVNETVYYDLYKGLFKDLYQDMVDGQHNRCESKRPSYFHVTSQKKLYSDLYSKMYPQLLNDLQSELSANSSNDSNCERLKDIHSWHQNSPSSPAPGRRKNCPSPSAENSFLRPNHISRVMRGL